MWLGQPFDECEWCPEVINRYKQAAITKILFPEFLNWGERFRECSPIDRKVWASTRGFVGDYIGTWQRKLFAAVANGSISDEKAAKALERYETWRMTHLQQLEQK